MRTLPGTDDPLDRHDVRVVQRLKDLDLAIEPRDGPGVVGPLGSERLRREPRTDRVRQEGPRRSRLRRRYQPTLAEHADRLPHTLMRVQRHDAHLMSRHTPG